MGRKRRRSGSNINRKVAFIFIGLGVILTIGISGAYDQVGADRGLDLDTTNDQNAMIQLHMNDPIKVGKPPGNHHNNPSNGKGGGGSSQSNHMELVTITNNFESDMTVDLDLTDKTDKGVNLLKSSDTIRSGQSQMFKVNINTNQAPKIVEVKIDVESNNGKIESNLYRTTSIEHKYN